MTAREKLLFETLYERHGELYLQNQLLLTENQTLADEVNTLRDQLSQAFRELSKEPKIEEESNPLDMVKGW